MNCRLLMGFGKVGTNHKVHDRLSTKIWGTHWSWHDVLFVMNPLLVDKFNELPDDVQTNIIDEYSASIAKGLESGIMSDWTVVMDCAIDMSNVKTAIEDAHFMEEQSNHGRSE